MLQIKLQNASIQWVCKLTKLLQQLTALDRNQRCLLRGMVNWIPV